MEKKKYFSGIEVFPGKAESRSISPIISKEELIAALEYLNNKMPVTESGIIDVELNHRIKGIKVIDL